MLLNMILWSFSTRRWQFFLRHNLPSRKGSTGGDAQFARVKRLMGVRATSPHSYPFHNNFLVQTPGSVAVSFSLFYVRMLEARICHETPPLPMGWARSIGLNRAMAKPTIDARSMAIAISYLAALGYLVSLPSTSTYKSD